MSSFLLQECYKRDLHFIQKAFSSLNSKEEKQGKDLLTSESSVSSLDSSNVSHHITGESQLLDLSKSLAFLHSKTLNSLLQFSKELPFELEYWRRVQDSWFPPIIYIGMVLPSISVNLFRFYSHPQLKQFFKRKIIFPRKSIHSTLNQLDYMSQWLATSIGLLIQESIGNRFQILMESNALTYHSIKFELTKSLLIIHLLLKEWPMWHFNSQSCKCLMDLIHPIVNASTDDDGMNIEMDAMHSRIQIAFHLLDEFHSHCTIVRCMHFKPRALYRFGLLGLFMGGISFYSLKKLYFGWKEIQFFFKEIQSTCFAFIHSWIYEPLYQMYETIRYKESKLRIVGANSLSSDLESLERMVVSFAKDSGIHDPNELLNVSEKTLQGDLTLVLESFEQELKTPIKSIVTGQLIRPLFIQIQKAKVDAALALSALDRLLRSNELNFAFMAFLPSFLFLWFSMVWIRNRFKFLKGFRVESGNQMMRTSMRQIERLLNRHYHDAKLSYQSLGYLLIEISCLRLLSLQFLSKKVHALFLKDLRELEEIFHQEWSVHQAMETCARMNRTFGFLHAPTNPL